jgi:hypothetical protein
VHTTTQKETTWCINLHPMERACTRERELPQASQEQSLSIFTVYKRIKFHTKS